MSDIEPLKSLEEFLFSAPLYKVYSLPGDFVTLKRIYGVRGDHVDGHCPFCKRSSTFTIESMVSIPNGTPWPTVGARVATQHMNIECARFSTHEIKYWYRVDKMTIEKIGQYPSLATVSNDEVAQYRKGMLSEDSQEFHKAIGLAAHGVGVGSFVYLRRVFERLVYRRFSEFKDAEGWTDEQFNKLRMSEKIEFLKGHLPAFLVDNAKIYSILSIGIHELDESKCLGYFDIMKHSIIIILDEDKKKREELELKSKFSQAIAKFDPQV